MTVSYIMIYLAPIFRYLLDYSKHFSVNDQMFMVDTKKPAWVFFAGWLEGGYFPIFPWCGFAVQGVAVGTLLYHPQKRDIPAVVNFIVRHALVGSTLLGGYYLMGSPKGIPEAPENAWTGHFYMYPATPTFCFLMSAISISVLLLCNLCFDEGRFDDKWIVRQAHPDKLVGHIMNIVSRESLFVYMFQAAVYYIVMAAANDSDPVDIPLYFGFLSAAGILIFLFVVLHFWEKVNFKFSPTWALSKITAYKKNIGTDKSLDENNDKRLSLTCL